ncbi:MAG: succinate dehydrogenase assembly factor 2 [Methylophilales bacterium]|nr:succinate dehydrogenase assembly factor 2 [Methylophilales bacterium]
MLELDIMLTRFIERSYCRLSEDQLNGFDMLLNFADNDLWDLVTEKTHSQNIHQQEVLHLLRQAMIERESEPA